MDAVSGFEVGDRGELHLILSGPVPVGLPDVLNRWRELVGSEQSGPFRIQHNHILVVPFEFTGRQQTPILPSELDDLIIALVRATVGWELYRDTGGFSLAGLLGGIDGKVLLILGGIALLAFNSQSEERGPKPRPAKPPAIPAKTGSLG